MERSVRAFERYQSQRGSRALLNPSNRRRIVGGLAAAFKLGRLDSTWGRHMLAKRGAKAGLRTIADAGEGCYAHFAAIGREGGIRSGSARRLRAEAQRLAAAHPRIRRILRP